MLKLRYYDELGERIREVDIFVVLHDDRFTQLIYTPFEAILFDKESRVIHFCCDTISSALERIERSM